ncbi:Hsp20/alpha crystallin family protein [Terrimonas ferruginea]|uniref:Hsp20/alpha crystallin family protein n=1 Tax=Terrimonas ferruginea TaxID=249 RepID=UPI0004003744|nr:Hsp20/alpha crystallin family protein [Terrimonas ferruginea]
MATKELTKTSGETPGLLTDFFKPWNEWFQKDFFLPARVLSVPAVNIVETSDAYEVSLAAPGMEKEDFQINVEGNLLTILAEKEVTKDEKEKKFTRKEYSYSSFSRSFNLPDAVNKDKIDARYENGVLHLLLPRNKEARQSAAKKIAVN